MDLKNIFSIENEYKQNDLGIVILKEKVITVFGHKIKIKKYPSGEIRNITNALNTLKNQNENKFCEKEDLIRLMVAAFSSGDDDLFCFTKHGIKYSSICIFSKDFFKLDRQFITDFLLFYFKNGNCHFNILDKKSKIYLKHITKNKNEICWRYRCEPKGISYFIITKNDNEITFKRGNFNNEEEMSDYTYNESETKTFKYVKGVCLREYLNNLSDEDKKTALKNFFDYIFKTYAYPGDKENVYTLDYQIANFIIDENGEYKYIDTQLKSDKKMQKQQMIYRVLKYSGFKENIREVYEYFLKIYNLEENFNVCRKEFDNRFSEKSKENWLKYKQLFEKYFGGNVFMPEDISKMK